MYTHAIIIYWTVDSEVWKISTMVLSCCRIFNAFLCCRKSCLAFTAYIICLHVGFFAFPCQVFALHYCCLVLWLFGILPNLSLFRIAPATPVTNIVQLLLTLRLIGASFEISDSWLIDKQLQSETLQPEDKNTLKLLKMYKSVEPSPLMIMSYAYSYIGLFTGPYYKLRTFEDFSNWNCKICMITEEPLSQHLQEAPPFGVAYLILSHFFTVDYVRTTDFYDRHFFYRLFYMMIVFFTFRMRIYFAWKMSECVCMSAGLGAYPKLSEPEKGEGPTNLRALNSYVEQQAAKNMKTNFENSLSHHHQAPSTANSIIPPSLGNKSSSEIGSKATVIYNYTTIYNLSVWGCEFAPTVRESIKSWNCCVQYWLATYFYKRCKAPRNIRTLWTMLVSAYWHGVHAGYYLSFLTIPLALGAESSLKNIIGLCEKNLPTGSASFLSWLLKMRVFEYCSMGFLILDWQTTIAYWSSIYYCVHIVLILLIIFEFFLRLVLPARAFNSSSSSKLFPQSDVMKNDAFDQTTIPYSDQQFVDKSRL
ncbi:unnamed protein product [Heterobilharzia americana]|nr:unnamed protein product [Heterobilharzia americana]